MLNSWVQWKQGRGVWVCMIRVWIRWVGWRMEDAVDLDDDAELVNNDYDISIEIGACDKLFEDFVDDTVTDKPPTESDEVEVESSGSSEGKEDVMGSDCDID
ncbi:hypothetical protein Salat_2485200 [Sesamum alatum]|uniref:Uncharacterized protein n=1 Tax=Sesamum alatum TaxID=300844 RepID=A0AAE2CC16_9LAMI|nr:hypothetical protein Salat_2485200 [Sesamum alatum]